MTWPPPGGMGLPGGDLPPEPPLDEPRPLIQFTSESTRQAALKYAARIMARITCDPPIASRQTLAMADAFARFIADGTT